MVGCNCETKDDGWLGGIVLIETKDDGWLGGIVLIETKDDLWLGVIVRPRMMDGWVEL